MVVGKREESNMGGLSEERFSVILKIYLSNAK